MAPCVSNGHVTGDVTLPEWSRSWPRYFCNANIWNSVRDRRSVSMDHR